MEAIAATDPTVFASAGLYVSEPIVRGGNKDSRKMEVGDKRIWCGVRCELKQEWTEGSERDENLHPTIQANIFLYFGDDSECVQK